MKQLASVSHANTTDIAQGREAPAVRLLEPSQRAEMNAVRDIFREYAASLTYSLHYQDFERELDMLPVPYEMPHGTIMLAAEGEKIVGCAALRPLSDTVAELRRLYVRPTHQGRGIGRLLATTVVNRGRDLGYRAMRFDAPGSMHAALTLCESLGFRQIPRYNDDPLPDAVFYENCFPSTRYRRGEPMKA